MSRQRSIGVWILALLFALPSLAHDEDPPKLLGQCGRDQLANEPYAEWFDEEYAGYVPNAGVVETLLDTGVANVDFKIFFGTWCGDSRREVPRMWKLLDELEIPAAQRSLIAVDGGGEMHKRSPGGEEKGLEIYRVPTIVVRRGGEEISRIVEYPALSLERDFLAILRGDAYQPSYASYPVIRRWLEDGLLADENVSPRGLANEVRGVVSGEGEIHAAARVLSARGQVAEAVKLLEVNCALHRDSSLCRARLAEGLIEAGDLEGAREQAERAMELNEDPEEVEDLVELLGRTLG